KRLRAMRTRLVPRHSSYAQKLRRRKRAASEAGRADGALEIEKLVDAHSHGRASRSLRSEFDFGGAILHAVYVAAKLAPVVNGGHVIPAPQRMQILTIEQRLLIRARLVEGVQTPASIDHADLEQHAVIGVVP